MTPDPKPVTAADLPHPPLNEVGALRALFDAVRTRIFSGLVLALPIALTFWILIQLYNMLWIVLWPVIWLVQKVLGYRGFDEQGVLFRFVAPVIAVVLVLSLLYLLGLFVRSRFHRAVDWVFLHLPVVDTIYKAISNVFQSLDNQLHSQRFKRVVLVEFPHPGARALAFVTNSLQDVTTGRTVLSVCVLTGVVPPAGFTLFVPEEGVTDIDWSVNQALQVILSGGITSPTSVHYFQGLHVPPTGPLLDPTGKPIEVGGLVSGVGPTSEQGTG